MMKPVNTDFIFKYQRTVHFFEHKFSYYYQPNEHERMDVEHEDQFLNDRFDGQLC